MQNLATEIFYASSLFFKNSIKNWVLGEINFFGENKSIKF